MKTGKSTASECYLTLVSWHPRTSPSIKLLDQCGTSKRVLESLLSLRRSSGGKRRTVSTGPDISKLSVTVRTSATEAL